MSDQLLLIHAKQTAKYPATCAALKGHLLSLARSRPDGVVDSDDAVAFLEANHFFGDKRVIGAVLRPPTFRMVGYRKSTRRRGMHATWKTA